MARSLAWVTLAPQPGAQFSLQCVPLHHPCPITTPLYAYWSDHNLWCTITPAHLTTALCEATQACGHHFGIQAQDISVQSLCSSGAMLLLYANVDTDHIHLLGCWCSDEMLWYLYVQASPIMSALAPLMLHHGAFALIPNTLLEG